MAFSTLLACLRIDQPNTDLLRVVSAAAQRFGSSVIGLVVKQASAHLASRGAGPFEPHQHDLHMFRERAAAAETEFRAVLSKVPNLDWRPSLTLGPASEHVANEARSADLVVLPAVRRERLHLPSGEADVGDLIMRLGRPALVVPPGAADLELNQVLVCWKDSRETRRAVADALPILRASRRVALVELVEAEGVEPSRRRLEEVAQWLARNGVEFEFVERSRQRGRSAAADGDREGHARRSDRRGRLRSQPDARMGVRRRHARPPASR